VEESLLVAAARRGNEKAFSVLVKKHERSLYLTALSTMGSSWDALDVLQDAFLEAYLKIESLRDTSKFKPWVTRILINKCYESMRGKRRVIVTDPVPDEAHEFIGTEANLDLLEAIKKLEDDHRIIIGLRYFRDLKVAEIAEVLGCPEGTVKSRINQAIKKLKVRLGKHSYLEVIE